MTLGTRVALIEEGRVLLVRQTYLPGWHFPGGGVEPGETAVASAVRELEEETGYRAGPLELRGLFHNVSAVTNRDHIAFFVGTAATRVAERPPDHEIAEIGWFAFDALPAQTTPATRRRIEELRAGGPATEMVSAWQPPNFRGMARSRRPLHDLSGRVGRVVLIPRRETSEASGW